MRGLRHITNHFRYIKGNNVIVAAFFVLGLGMFGVAGLSHYEQAKAAEMVRNCDNNAIMYCGAATPAEFKQKFVENKPGDLPAIYSHYWIPQDLQVVQGQSFRDGTVRVNGKVVATNAKSIGRQKIAADSRMISIGGKTYYETPNATAFNADGLPTMVALDAKGNFKYAIINGCGNPVYATPAQAPTPPPTTPAPPKTPEQPKPQAAPKYTCDYFNVENLSDTKKRFTVRSTALNGAQKAGYRIDFGDGSTQDISNDSVTYTYAQEGTYTARATAKFTVNGSAVEATGPNCVVQVTVSQKEVCEYDSSLPKDSPNCVKPVTPVTTTPTTPTEMPKTGAGSLIASGLGLGSLMVAGSFYAASRRDLISAFLSR